MAQRLYQGSEVWHKLNCNDIIVSGRKMMTTEEFIKSKDFMKLGQSIEHNNWQLAGMIAQRMQRNAKSAGVSDFDRQLVMIKQCIGGRQKTEALNALAGIVNKRVKMLSLIQESEPGL